MGKLTFSFTLDDEKDKRIVRWLKAQGKRQRSKAIRDALNTYLGKGGTGLGDIYEILQRIDRKLNSGVMVAQSVCSEAEADIPADVLERLDTLGL